MGNDLDGLFSPRSVALYGIPRGLKPGKVFLMGLLDQGFAGPIYLVHPEASEIDGLRAYPSLEAIGREVDLVIVMSPRDTVFTALAECARVRVKAVIVYTSGFSELYGTKGRTDEERMRRMAQEGGFRLLGPNCMGVFSPASCIAPFPGMPKESGGLGFISQSGSLVNLFVNLCTSKGISFRCAVSTGNAADIDLADLLDWMGTDENTRVICSYCEGVRDARRLLDAMRRVTPAKPVIMWKAGLTPSGARAASSHTGALAGDASLWKCLFRQFNILDVHDIEEMCDVVMAFLHLGPSGTGRIAVISGPGGPAVSAADAVENSGLTLSRLSVETLRRLRSVIPPTGTSCTNPVDVGLGASFDVSLYLDALKIVLEDDGVDAVVVLGGGATRDMSSDFVKGLLQAKSKSAKHIIAIAYPGFVQISQEEILAPLYAGGIPVYPSPKRALRAYGRMLAWSRHQGAGEGCR